MVWTDEMQKDFELLTRYSYSNSESQISHTKPINRCAGEIREKLAEYSHLHYNNVTNDRDQFRAQFEQLCRKNQ